MSETEETVAVPAEGLLWRHAARRVQRGTRSSANWIQLLKFGAVGASG